MPTPDEVRAHLEQYGDQSPFYPAMNEDAKRVAAAAVAAHRRMVMDSGGPDPFETDPQTTTLMYQDFLQRAQLARGIKPATSLAVQRAQTIGGPAATGVLGGAGKGVEAGAMRVGALAASPFLSEEQSMENFAAANKRGSEVEGLPAEISRTVAQTGTEMAPLLAASVLSGGAVLPVAGTTAARVAGLGTAAGGAGLQSGVPEFFERRAQGMDPAKAAEVAAAKGLSTTAITALFGFTGVESLANPVARAALRGGFHEYLKTAAKGATSEAIEEATDETLQAFIDQKVAGDTVTPAEFLERIAVAGGLGGLFGSAGAVASKARAGTDAVPPAGAQVPPAAQPSGAVTPRNVGVAVRKVLSGELAPGDLTPAHAALIADMMRQQSGSRQPAPQIQQIIDQLDARSGVTNEGSGPAAAALPSSVAPASAPAVAPAPGAVAPAVGQQPAAAPTGTPEVPTPSTVTPTQDVLKGIKQLADQMAKATAALNSAAATKVPAPAATATQEVSNAQEVRPVRQEGVQGQEAPGRQEGQEPLRPQVKGPNATLDERGANAFEAAVKSDPIALARYVRKVGVREGSEADLNAKAEQLVADAREEAKRRASKIRTTPEKAAEIEQRFVADAQERAAELKSNWAVALTMDQVERARQALTGKGRLAEQALARLDEQARRSNVPSSLEQTGGTPLSVQPAGVVVKAERRNEPASAPEPVGPVVKAPPADFKPAPPAKPQVFTSEDAERMAAEDAARPAVAPTPGKPALGQGGVQQEASLPAAEPQIRPFGVSEDPESPAFVQAVRERAVEALTRRARATGQAGQTDIRSELRSNPDEIAQELRQATGEKALTAEDLTAKVAPVIRKRLVQKDARIATGRGKSVVGQLYEAPGGWSKVVNEYVALHKKHGAVARQQKVVDRKRQALATATDQLKGAKDFSASKQVVNRLTAVEAKLARELAMSEKELARRQGAKGGLNATETKRLRTLSNGIRAHFAEGVAKQMADHLRAQPGSERRTVAKRFEDAIQRGLVGLEQDLQEIIGTNELVDPARLQGANQRVFIAEVEPGQFMAVVPHPKTPNTYAPLNQDGDVISRFPKARLEAPSAIEGDDAPGERIIQGKSIGDLRAGMDVEGRVTPFITPNLGELIDLVQTRDLELPESALARGRIDWMLQNGFGVDMKGDQYKTGQAEPKVNFEGEEQAERRIERAQRGRIDDLTARDYETPETYLNRVLLTSQNEGHSTDEGNIGKRVNAKLLKQELESTWGSAGLNTLAELERVNAIKKRGEDYVTEDMRLHYRKVGSAPGPATQDANQSAEDVWSQQAQVEYASVLFDLDSRIGARHGQAGGALGAYDVNARCVLMGQYDLPTFFHELFHDLTLRAVQTHPPVVSVQNELIQLARAAKLPPLMSEGAAELGTLYVNDPAGTRAKFPAATGWVEAVLAAEGTKARVDNVVQAHQAWLKATPEQRAKAAVVSKNEVDERNAGESRIGSWAWRSYHKLTSAMFDQFGYLRAVSRRIAPALDSVDSAYEHKMLEAGWQKSAADSFLNGFVLDVRTGARTASFGDVLKRAKDLGVTGERFASWQAYMKWMSVLDASPRLRRAAFKKLGMNESDFGFWAMDSAWINDPFDTMDEVRAANAQMDKDWEARVSFNKAAGKPPPPKPVHYAEKDPSPGTSADAPSNYTEKEVADAAAFVKDHPVGDPFHVLTVPHLEAVNAFDDWKFANGIITAKARASNRARRYYVPGRTENEMSVAAKVKGSGGADTIEPYDALWDKVATAHWNVYSQGSARAWLRTVVDARENRRAAGEQHNEKLDPLAGLGSFTSLDEAVRDYEAIASKVASREQTSPVVDQYVVIRLDADTLDSLMAAGLINPLTVKDPNSLIGTPIAYRVQDPAIRKAIETPTLPWSGAPWLFKAPAQMVRKLATTFNPEFWVKTVIRDTLQAGIQTATGRNPIRFIESTGKGVVDAWTAAGELVSDRAKTDPIYAAFVQSGVQASALMHDASTATSVLSSHDLGRVLNQAANHNPKFGWLRKAASVMERVADTTEAMNRAGEMRRSIADQLGRAGVKSLNQLSQGKAKSILMNAARQAQEVTVNFRRVGGWTPIRYLNDVIPFFNAAIQGSRRGLQALTFQERFPGETTGQKLVNGLTVYSILALPALLQHLFLHDDAEDRDAYMELSDQERMLFYHIPVGPDAAGRPRFAKIPKPQGPFTGVIAAFEKMFSDDPRTWSDIGWDTFKQVTPQSFIPTTLQLGIELFTNERVGQTASRIGIPDRLKNVDEDSQDATWLSPSSYAVAKVVPWLSPLEAENLIRGYTGGMGWLLLDTPHAVMDAMGADPRASYDAGQYPLARLFCTQDPAFASRSITRMYDLLETVNRGEQTFKQEVRKVEEGRSEPEQLVAKLDEKPEIAFGHGATDELTDFRAQMAKARILWENINRDQKLTPVERRIKMDGLVDLMVQASQDAFKSVQGAAVEVTGKPLDVPRR